jgi:hypothetical protein
VDPLAGALNNGHNDADDANSSTPTTFDVEDDEQIIASDVDNDVLWESASSFSNVRSETYHDDGGNRFESTWSTKHSTQRPAFAISIYLGEGCRFAPEALFSLWNRGPISYEAWTSDTNRCEGSLAEAAARHSVESNLWREPRIYARRACANMVLEHVIDGSLPVEIFDHIHHFLVPPAIPDFSFPVIRRFRDFMLYLDGARVDTGPKAVYSRPVAPHRLAHTPLIDRSQPLVPPYPQDIPLSVSHLRYWHRVSDEIHTLWSMCSARSLLPAGLAMPQASLQLRIADNFQLICGGQPELSDNRRACSLLFSLQANSPVTIHKSPLFSANILLGNALELYDITSKVRVPQQTVRGWDEYYHRHSWSRTPALGSRLGLRTNHHRFCQ